jgi:hypothetical protein
MRGPKPHQSPPTLLEIAEHEAARRLPIGYRAPCDPDVTETVYEAAGGADGLLRLAGAWHGRVMSDEVVSHAFSHGFHPEHTERLAAYWGEASGGPTTFSAKWGDETSVRAAAQRERPARRDGPSSDRLLRSGAGRRRSCRLRASPAGAARLLRVGDHDHDVPLSPIRK